MKTKTNRVRTSVAGTAVLLMLLSIFSFQTYAQNKWSFEVRPGVDFATKKLGGADLKTGFGFEGTFAYRFMPHLAVYAGWSWNRFGSDQSLDFEETGYTYGLQFIHPIGDSNIEFLARAGATSNHIEVEDGDQLIADTGHGFGFQLESGVVIPIGESWNLLPSIRYRSLSRDIDFGQTTTAVDLNYVSIGVGFAKTF
ncbi:MAG: outer membrane beta-barrel protein [Cyclobacteriaceae bacterium]